MELYTNNIVLMNDGKLYKYIATIEGVWNLVHLFIDEDMNVTRVKDHQLEEFVKDNIREVYKQPEVTSNLKDFKYKIELKEDFNLSDLVKGYELTFRNGIYGTFDGTNIIMKETTRVDIYDGVYCWYQPDGKKIIKFNMDEYRNDLRHKTIKSFDIMRVHSPKDKIYERDINWSKPSTPINVIRIDEHELVKKEITEILQNRRASFPS